MAVHRLRAAEIANLEESLGAAALDESGAAGGDAMTGCSGRFDWLLDFNEIKDCIVPAMRQSVADPETVVLGCGNSTLSHTLVQHGFTKVCSVDIDEPIIEFMRQQHPEMRWEVSDLTNCQAELPDGTFQVALDKGTLDAILCMPDVVVDMLFEVNRMMQLGGVYIVISVLAPRELLQKIATIKRFGFEGVPLPLEAKHGINVFQLKKVSECDRCDEARQDLQEALDWWFATQNPMLTSEREAELRGSWGNQSLSFRKAWEIGFDEVERDNYMYEDFLDDVETCDVKVEGSISIDEFLVFLADNQ